MNWMRWLRRPMRLSTEKDRLKMIERNSLEAISKPDQATEITENTEEKLVFLTLCALCDLGG